MALKVNLVKRGITEEFQKINFETYLDTLKPLNLHKDETARYKKIREVGIRWISAFIEKKVEVPNLFLTGRSQSGKSAFGCVIIRTLLENNIRAFRVSIQKLNQLYYQDFSIPEVSYASDIMFLEDVGKEPLDNGNKHREALVEYIIKYRNERKFLTIISSEGSREFLGKRYGETLEDIIVAKYYPVSFPDVSLGMKLGMINNNKFMGV